MATQTETLKVPKEPASDPENQRAITLPPLLMRQFPSYGQPSWLSATKWRQFVRNQPVAIICRDTLIANMLHMDWDVVSRNPDDGALKRIKDNIDYYKNFFTYIGGDFDLYLDLLMQDMLDLPMGAVVEIGRLDDKAGNAPVWAEHVDAATCMLTYNTDFPIYQQVPHYPSTYVTFPKHAVERVYMTPRPELRYKDMGMAPPQKIYMAINMLFEGDKYYWKLLIDTPEAGILDLGNMEKDKAMDWLSGMKSDFMGVDGFKVPVLYAHDQEAKWIPLNRPPTDLLYDQVSVKYAQLVAAGYGLRLSDIGLDEVSGEKTLAGVIRGERQTKRSGRAVLKAKTENHFNKMLPKELKFIWKEQDDEGTTARGTAMQAVVGGLAQAIQSGLMDAAEGRAEIVASGVLETSIDPKKVPEKDESMAPIIPPMPFGQQPQPGQPGQPQPGQPQTAPAQQPVPATQGGRGGVKPVKKTIVRPQDATTESLLERMADIVRPGLEGIPVNAGEPQIRRLITAATREMFDVVSVKLKSMKQEQINLYWLPEIHEATFDRPNNIESPIVRRNIEDAKRSLESHLIDDAWWSVSSVLDKALVLEFFARAYELGLENGALEIIRSLYVEGLSSTALLAPSISFNLTNKATMRILERSAADLVTNVNSGTKYFIKRMVVAGVRQGMSSPRIANAIRDGAAARDLLARDDYMGDVEKLIREGLIDMSERRSNSIANTEIRRAENLGKLGQFTKAGLTEKKWVHRGDRGETKLGNPHPCPTCTGNEEMKFVDITFAFPTVFKTGGVDGEGGSYVPPGHPTVCHCTIEFKPEELYNRVKAGTFKPWTGK